MKPKKLSIIIATACAAIFFLAAAGSAQQIAYFDSDKVLASMQGTKDVETKLQEIQKQWILEAQALQDTLRQMYEDYQNIESSVIVSKSTKNGMLQNIQELEQQILDFQNEKFGQGGEIYQKQQELMQPLIDQVLSATQVVLKEKGYDIALDKTQVFTANDTYDITKNVLAKLKEMGVKTMEEKKSEEGADKGGKAKKDPKQ